jgi:hypothetical protein
LLSPLTLLLLPKCCCTQLGNFYFSIELFAPRLLKIFFTSLLSLSLYSLLVYFSNSLHVFSYNSLNTCVIATLKYLLAKSNKWSYLMSILLPSFLPEYGPQLPVSLRV